MDWKVQPTQVDVEQFLRDVREHFRASLETSEYENTSNMFHVTEAESTVKLLLRCELLLEQYETEKPNQQSPADVQYLNQNQMQTLNQDSQVDEGNAQQLKTSTDCTSNQMETTATTSDAKPEDTSYLDMSGRTKKNNKIFGWYGCSEDFVPSKNTFSCSTENYDPYSEDDSDNNGDTDDVDDDDDDGDGDNKDKDNDKDNEDADANSQGYDICQVSHFREAETKKTFTPELEPMQMVNCPYMDLPAGHLAIQKATKYGQLQRIEKRLFFDQTKKYYCGVLYDWLLCYADGPTAAHPTVTLHLKQHNIEIEHYGEGKRRELCFQITTADPNKKFLFQAINEVDAKEWIVAVETAIRGDGVSVANKHARKLPSPPIITQLTFVSDHNTNLMDSNGSDCIYEEPSPLYQPENLPGKPTPVTATAKPPDLPEKSTFALTDANCYEYDIPKCPPQPIQAAAITSTTAETMQNESETAGLLNSTTENIADSNTNGFTPPKLSATTNIVEKIEFQSIIKDVHSKLSSQLTAGGGTERLKKVARKTYSGGSSDAEAVALTQTSIISPVKESKKQRKSNTPTPSPQKITNNSNNNIINNNNNNNGLNNTSGERTAVKSWFFNRLSKTTSSTRSNGSVATPNNTKYKQSEKENLLNSLEIYDTLDGGSFEFQHNNNSNPASPILKMPPGDHSNVNSKSKVNLIIKEFEANAHLGMFNLETLAGSAVASLSSYCDNDCNNYEPIMTIAAPPSSFMKKV